MTLREILLQELEASDDQFIAQTIEWVRSHKHNASASPANSPSTQQGAKLGNLLEFAGTWAGDDLEDCLETVYNTRSKVNFSANCNPFQ
jgi:hypothetical protein